MSHSLWVLMAFLNPLNNILDGPVWSLLMSLLSLSEKEQRPLRPGGRRRVNDAGRLCFTQKVSVCVCVSVCLCWCVTDGATHHSVCSEQTAAVGAYGLPTLWLLGETLYFATKVISVFRFLLWQHSRSTVLQQQFNKVGKVETGSVALPAIMRSGAGGPESFQMGSMPQAKQHITSGQMHRGHMPPLVKQ